LTLASGAIAIMNYPMRATGERGNLWELAVLALLREEPMHPYQMQRLIVERHLDAVLGLKRGSLYHAINRLTRAGLIEPVGVEREGRRPERTTYRLAGHGEEEFVAWLRKRVATPQREPSEFMGSLSFLVHLTPRDALVQLGARARAIEERMESLAETVRRASASVGRIHLIESEYQLAMHQAELSWVRGRTAEIKSGKLAWDVKKILRDVRAARRRTARKERRA
jgi:DNA-binding PadR family transcriptional regulator